MFSALRQNNIVYILDKSNGLTLKTGKVISNSGANTMYSPVPQTLVNLTIEVEGETKEFNNVPAMESLVNYNNGSLLFIDNIDRYKQVMIDGEEVLKSLNPQFAKDKARDEDIASLKEKVGGMENKLDTIIGLLGKSGN